MATETEQDPRELLAEACRVEQDIQRDIGDTVRDQVEADRAGEHEKAAEIRKRERQLRRDLAKQSAIVRQRRNEAHENEGSG